MSEVFNMPKLSFIVLSYNHSEYIKECIDSILTQSYKDIEIIVVDDHSNDKSVELIQNIINANKTNIKIELIAHKRSKGSLACIIDGISNSSGKFIACINPQEKLLKDFALTHIGIHLFNPIALSVCEVCEIDENSVLSSLVSNVSQKEQNGEIIKDIKIKMSNIKNNSIIKILDKKTNFYGGWWWAPISCAVFEKEAVLPLLSFEATNNWRKKAEYLLFNFLHLIDGSIKIYEPLVAYRKQEFGNKYELFENNQRFIRTNIFKDMIKFFKKEKKKLTEKYSKQRYNKYLRQIYLSIPKLIIHNLLRKT